LVFSVEDSGIGINAEDQEKIFQAFEQQQSQDQAKYGGTGLGLAISKRLVQAMSGTIRLSSEVGKGSKFCVVLNDVAIASLNDLGSSAEQIDPDSLIFTNPTVLIVDDIRANLELVRGFLDGFYGSIQYLFAENGQQAVELAHVHVPDLIFMDMKMPVMDGYEATENIKKTPSLAHIPIVALTASAMVTDVDKIGQLCDGYLCKPVSRSELAAALAQHLEHQLIDCDEPSDVAIVSTSEVQFKSTQMARFPELLSKLNAILDSGVWDALCDGLTINEVEDFGQEMYRCGVYFEYPPLLKWGQTLAEQASMFEMDKMALTLSEFAGLVASLKSVIEAE
jgi:CheY-like chemotaxis protein